MACKDRQTPKANSAIIGKISSPVAPAVSSPEEISKALDNFNVQKVSDKQIVKVSFPKEDLALDKTSVNIGKKAIFINKTTFGPTEKQRLAGTIINRDGESDNFRAYSAKYWTIIDKTVGYLSSYSTKHKIIDYNFGNRGVLTPQDIKEGSGRQATSFYGTKQWILISADQSKFLISTTTNNKGTPLVKPASGPTATVTNILTADPIQAEVVAVAEVPKTAQATVVTTADPNSIPRPIQAEVVAVAQLPPEPLQAEVVAVAAPPSEVYANINQGGGLATAGGLRFSENLWHTYLFGGVQNGNVIPPIITEQVDYFDFVFEVDLPFTKKELESFSGINSPAFIEVDPEYNFFSSPYEFQADTPEQITPNMYILGLELDKNLNNDLFLRALTFGGEIELKNLPAKDDAIKGQYYDLFTYAWRKIKTGNSDFMDLSQVNEIKRRLAYLAFDNDNIDLLNEFSFKKYLFPFYTDISFSADKTAQIAEIIRESKLSRTLFNSIKTIRPDSQTFYESKILTQQLPSGELKKTYNLTKDAENVWDLTEAVNTNNLSNITYLGKEEDNTKQAFVDLLGKIVFLGKLRTLTKNRFRTYEQLIEGKPAYSETVAYRIRKFSLPDGTFVQDVYLPNSSKVDVLNYIDTQVKYGKRYKYEISAFQVVVGTKYKYSDLQQKHARATFQVTQEPYIVMVEVPYYEFEGGIFDHPPVPPEVDIIPYRNINNQVLIWLNGATGRITTDPVLIEESDKVLIDDYRATRDLPGNSKITFRSDDPASSFQIFRTDVAPTSYQDFAGKLKNTIQSDIDEETPQKASSAAIVDDIRPNTKYWYCFRAVDIHGNISNPTGVFQVEIVDNESAIYPIIEEYQFKEKVSYVPSKSGRKYLYVAPTFAQTLINETKTGVEDKDSAGDLKNVALGVKERSVWGKSYLIKIKSKQTGKTIRLRFNVDNNFTNPRVESS